MKNNVFANIIRLFAFILILGLGFGADSAYNNYSSAVGTAESAVQASQLSGEALLKATGEISLMVMVFFLWVMLEVIFFILRYDKAHKPVEPVVTKTEENLL